MQRSPPCYNAALASMLQCSITAMLQCSARRMLQCNATMQHWLMLQCSARLSSTMQNSSPFTMQHSPPCYNAALASILQCSARVACQRCYNAATTHSPCYNAALAAMLQCSMARRHATMQRIAVLQSLISRATMQHSYYNAMLQCSTHSHATMQRSPPCYNAALAAIIQ